MSRTLGVARPIRFQNGGRSAATSRSRTEHGGVEPQPFYRLIRLAGGGGATPASCSNRLGGTRTRGLLLIRKVFCQLNYKPSRQRPGIEPDSGASCTQESNLPRRATHRQHCQWVGPGSNRRRSPLQGDALPLSYQPATEGGGVEPQAAKLHPRSKRGPRRPRLHLPIKKAGDPFQGRRPNPRFAQVIPGDPEGR